MSVLGKKWLILNQSNLPTLEKLFANRNFDPQNEQQTNYDPYLFSQMPAVIERIERAIEKQEKIIIFGDYDVDGITASAILIHTLKALGAQVSFRLPNRVTDGYGLSEKFIDEFIEKGIDLVITVDCGIACAAEVKKAKENGVDVIITDHHRVPENKPDTWIIHPQLCEQYPYSELTGAGVALKLSQALIHKHLPKEQASELEQLCYQFASLGTVADLGPLTDENRHIVKVGLQALNHTRFGGLKRLKEVVNGDKINTHSIGYQLAPRINAAGRIGDPYKALFLLLQHQDSEKSLALAQELESLNLQRREMTATAIDEISHLLDRTENPAMIIEASSDWHVGILGLIAGKVAEKYNRPAIIFQDLGDRLTASARSPEYFNVIEAISQFPDLLSSFGGHAQAAGLSISKENFQQFKESISAYTSQKIADLDTQPQLKIDCEVEINSLDLELFKQIETLAPFGIANQKPVFLLRDLKVNQINTVGKEANHLKFSVSKNQQYFKVIGFHLGQQAAQIPENSSIDLVCQLHLNNWNNHISLELQALDFKVK